MVAKIIHTNLEAEIDLPNRPYIFSHVQNIEYCIGILTTNLGIVEDPVIGYLLATSLSTIEMGHQILPKNEAQNLRKEYRKQNLRYEFTTLDQLLEEKKKIEINIYRIGINGRIIGFTEDYRRKMGWVK